MRKMRGIAVNRAHNLFSKFVTDGRSAHGILSDERGRNGFDGIESRWEGVPGSELP